MHLGEIMRHNTPRPWCNSRHGPWTSTLSRLHDHPVTPHSVGLLWTSDQLDAETSTYLYTTLTTDRLPCPRQDSNTPFPASERPQTHVSDGAATGMGRSWDCICVSGWPTVGRSANKIHLLLRRAYGGREASSERNAWMN